MSRTKIKRISWVGWIASILLIAGAVWLWAERQLVVDTIQYVQYKPSPAIEDVVQRAKLTDDAKFTFYATRPSIEDAADFNRHCERKESDSPILGCYSMNRIYIFNVTDERLKGIKVVTAAHELLHAEYDRLPAAEKDRINRLLLEVYDKSNTAELKTRMDYYEKTEPGQSINELHSIIGTEFENVGSELEKYYKKFLKDRQGLVQLHAQVNQTFEGLSEEADKLVDRIEKLAFKINTDTKQYNGGIEALNRSVGDFNDRAASTGGFTTQSEFQAARTDLLRQRDELNRSKESIQSDVTEYKNLLTQLESINSESASLNKSLDSVLSDTPEIK